MQYLCKIQSILVVDLSSLKKRKKKTRKERKKRNEWIENNQAELYLSGGLLKQMIVWKKDLGWQSTLHVHIRPPWRILRSDFGSHYFLSLVFLSWCIARMYMCTTSACGTGLERVVCNLRKTALFIFMIGNMQWCMFSVQGIWILM